MIISRYIIDLARNIITSDFDIHEREYVGELAKRSCRKTDKTVNLLKFNNHIIVGTNLILFSSVFDVPAVNDSSTDQTSSTDIFELVSIKFEIFILKSVQKNQETYSSN